MNTNKTSFWRLAMVAVFLVGLILPTPSEQAVARQPFSSDGMLQYTTGTTLAPNIIVDGIIDAEYGEPRASDPAGDGNGSAVMDLLDLYIAEDAGNFYFAFVINGNVSVTNWGKYVIYIDTTNDTNGATSDAWTRNVVVSELHEPEYGLYSYMDCPTYNASCTQFWQWGGSSWSQSGTVDEAARSAGDTSVLEWRISKSRLGNPSNIWVEVWDTGVGDHDNAQDTINDPADDWNATDWLTTAELSVSTLFPPTGLLLTVSFPPEGYTTVQPELTVAGTVSPTVGVTVTVDVNGTTFFSPTVDSSGAFSQPVTLPEGANLITISATDGVETAVIERHVQVGAGHDNNIWWSDLGHDSRDPLYRYPAGAITTQTPVTLRLRSASGDLTNARVRLWNDRLNTQTLLEMQSVLNDGLYEWWEATLPASALPTVYWYRFIVVDGTDVDYYEDDRDANGRPLGGWGMAYDDTQDLGWQITVYDPSYQTPDWVKNGIIYQVFPDRFRNGDETNDTPAGSFFYDSPQGTVYRSNASDWNTVVCDPRDPEGDCPQVWSENFYGGDLQGLIDQLDYLVDLGVTIIYLNPIFEAPSNHKYDTTDYSVIDDNFGDLATFQNLIAQADARGMKVILDGVFNHTSSDSIYFDRYSRFPEVGACESQDSPTRDWFFFRTAIPPGSGPCVGDDGTPGGAVYDSWAGYDSLPKLNSANPEVRDLIWNNGTASIGPYWVDQGASGWRLDVAGDVDPGTTNDPTNDYWEGFRAAVRDVYSQTYIVGEEWGYASSWTLGNEWDATMNYQFGAALLSFWRDEPLVDNDHNSGSSIGALTPLSPSELNERLLNLQERYAPEAFYAMLNLLDSHDTSRALFLLDHNTDLISTTLYLNPDYDWGDAITRLKGVALLQMTLPGAPTIYYGDEVGLVGPQTYVVYGPGNEKWEDDPYNRQPYPWLDETGLPFYTYLQSAANQQALFDYYSMLTTARNEHPALRTGSFDPLLVDDENNVYAFGRMMPDRSDIAVVITNRQTVTQTVNVDVGGYLAYGDQVQNIFDNALYIVDGQGLLTLDVPGMSGAVLLLVPDSVTPPDPVTDLSVLAEGSNQLSLGWSAASLAESYDVYRSSFSHGGYELVTNTISLVYTATGLTNSQAYYFVVVSRDEDTGLLGGYSNQVNGIPHDTIDIAYLYSPPEITHTIGITPTEFIFGRVLISGVTSAPGATPGLSAQLGFGLQGTPPISWTEWVEAEFTPGFPGPDEDEFRSQLVPELIGEYDYAYRFTTTGGRDWVYADLSGIITPTGVISPGILHVVPSDDLTAPGAPQGLQILLTTAGSITLGWDGNTEPDLAGYDVYRAPYSGTLEIASAIEGPGPFTRIARVGADSTAYTDTTVTTDQTYQYYMTTFDVHFNFSIASEIVTGTAESRPVSVTFTVRVPEYTPGTVYIVGDNAALANWNPGALPMTQIGPDLWSYTTSVFDGTALQYKYTRSNWDTVEAWGSITGYTNRQVTISYGSSGMQLVDDTATDWGNGPDDHKAVKDWRDPIVTNFSPDSNATGIPVTTTIQATWSHTMTVDTEFEVTSAAGLAAGVFTLDDTGHILTFTPDVQLAESTIYTVTVSGQNDAGGQIQQAAVFWQFQTSPLPLVQFSAASRSVDESAGAILVTVTLDTPSLVPVTVDYATTGGTASPGSDYIPVSGTLSFEPGETVATFLLTIVADELVEGDETIWLTLSLPVGATPGDPLTLIVTILGNDRFVINLPVVIKP